MYKDNLKKLLREGLDSQSTITVFHGTNNKNLESIKSKGLDSKMGYNNAQWYMVSTDLESALYHATPEEGGPAIVFEFEIPLTNTKWVGYPYFWPPYERNDKSSWFALKQQLTPNLIKNIHEIDYEKYLNQKNLGY